MTDTDRFRLLFGPYRTPRFRYGSIVSCRRRGDVIVCGITDARIPWPIARRRGSSARSLVLYRDLVRGVQRESAQAVAYWWGVTDQTVTTWRKVLGVKQNNAGTLRLRRDHFHEPWAEKA